jgi:ApaG protein
MSTTNPVEKNLNVKVKVTSNFNAIESNPSRNLFAFNYTVVIKNNSSHIIQLLERAWHIYSGDIKINEVRGEGVIGKKPVLQPEEVFTYTSFTIIHDPIGFMEGEYLFRTLNQEDYTVVIPRFKLVYMQYLH